MIRPISLFAACLWLGALSPAAAQPAGSYRQTCTDVSQRGPLLEAYCRDTSGRFIFTQLDLRRCDGGVTNSNGLLTCNRVAERRGRGYDDDRDDDRRGDRGRRYDDDDRRFDRRRYDGDRDRYDARGERDRYEGRRGRDYDDEYEEDYRRRR